MICTMFESLNPIRRCRKKPIKFLLANNMLMPFCKDHWNISYISHGYELLSEEEVQVYMVINQ